MSQDDDKTIDKLCPLLKDKCRKDCAWFMDFEESMAKKCAVYVAANQLDILAKDKGDQAF